MKRLTSPARISLQLPLFSFILIVMATVSTRPAGLRAQGSVLQVSQEPRVARALAWLEKNLDWVTEQHIQLTEIPAPPFGEAQRGASLRKLFEASGLKVRTDEVGNVIGERAGSRPRDVVLVAAHLDTVFPPGTEVRVRREGTRLLAPGISDNGAGLAALVGVARALHEGKLQTRITMVFVGTVGEEGEGNLRGMRRLVESYRGRLRAVVVLDGASTEHIVTRALASRRLEAVVTGPGGHSWSDFGLPNPIHALSRGIARFVRVRVPEDPRTSFNVGEITGGTSVNSIPHRAAIKVDLRSESEAELERLENAFREAVAEGVEEEMAAARERGAAQRHAGARLETSVRLIGVRPGGELPADSPLLATVRDVDRFLGIPSRLERSSTDANVPLSMGIPAVSFGGGGRGGAVHSLNEWYEASGRELGLKRLLLTVVTLAGVEK